MKEWQKQLMDISERIGLMMKSVNKSMSAFSQSEEYRRLADFFKNIPEDIQKTELFQHIQGFEKAEITFDDVLWMQDILGYETYEMSVNSLYKKTNKSKLDEYIISVVNNEGMSPREKIVVLLAHFENLIYQTITYERQSRDRVKKIVTDNSKDSHKMEMENYKKILLAGIVYIIFSNTDNYKGVIEKRIPFRNNILHRGTISYSKEEINKAYEILVYFISELDKMNR